MTKAVIIGTGFFVPENVITNQDLTQWMDTSDEWITERSGIKERRWLTRDSDGNSAMSGAEMGAEAARMAIQDAGLEPTDIDQVIFATLNPDVFFPGNGVFIEDFVPEEYPVQPPYEKFYRLPVVLRNGRNTILVAEGAYHGAGPWCTPGATGITEGDRANQLTYTYNDVESLKAAAAKAGDDLAAIVVSPFKHDVFVDQEWPTQDFARTARALCDDKEAALILDDVRACFRFTTGSTWETIDVLPDLCAMSKSVANGYPLAVITGNDRFRSGASQIYVTGSFWFSSVAFAASLATIEAVESEGAIEKMETAGTLLRKGLDDQANSYGFKLRQTGPVQMPLVLIDDDPMWQKNNFFCDQAAQRGVYMHPWHNMFTCAAHSEKDIQEALQRTEGAFAALKSQFGEG